MGNLVRDLIPQVIQLSGRTPITSVVTGEDLNHLSDTEVDKECGR